ncbi:electron transport complex subunit RsxC [Vogesella sp. DC21W]|uniref:Ion-translocating oxidoreductase complex subunit C n=1 Tax=Vogesella aquatica TaxID=2984206 RepID=A0ABT5J142_9NEIS|nr:electron transport complex subunit RsxC [Vogesella aquatica]MDC7718526.1 electron transport complex subunit RsxC [Vogesella aquatica]
MSRLYDFHGGIHPPQHKDAATGSPIQALPLPPLLHIALAQSVGNAARPTVAVGQHVRKGETLAEPDGRLSAAVHAPTSGTITAIGPHPFAHPSGLPVDTLTLQPDGLDEWQPRQPLDWQQADGTALRKHLQAMGVVGLGGAAFPTHLKLAAGQLATLVVNGAECEPFISCDDLLMRERATSIVDGIRIAAHALQAGEVLIGIEDNKPQAIAAMQAACAGTAYRVVSIPTKYPSGGAKQLIRILTGIEVPHGTRATDLGVQCLNVGTLYAIARAVLHGEPLLSRIVTVTGAVTRAANYEVAIGTPLAWLLQQAGISDPGTDVIMGGPMMGITLPDLAAGLPKAGNCLIAKSAALFPPRPAEQACIRCGDCASACPAELQPMDLFWFAKSRQFGKAQERHLFDCIECGACSYVCPSQIPLVDYYRFAKSEIWTAERDKKNATLARQRHEFRQFRIERDKSEKAARIAARAAEQAAKLATQAATPVAASTAAASGMDDAKKAAIAAALARAAAQKEAKPLSEQHTSGLDDAKQAAIQAAMARAAARKAAAEAAKAGDAANPDRAATATPAQTGMDDAKRAAIEAAMARAAARKAAAQSAQADNTAAANPDSAATATTSQTGIDDAKRAAIEAAMARAAARKAAAAEAKKDAAP